MSEKLTREMLEAMSSPDRLRDGDLYAGGIIRVQNHEAEVAALALSLMDERDAARDILIGSADVICANCLNFETGQRVSCDPTCPVFIAISLQERYKREGSAMEPQPEGGA